jgi:hypothetical protein
VPDQPLSVQERPHIDAAATIQRAASPGLRPD